MFPEIRRREVGDVVALPGVSPVLRRVYAARGIASADELAYDLRHLPPFGDLAGIDRAVELLADTIAAGTSARSVTKTRRMVSGNRRRVMAES